ncbi:MAG: hypothetical protein JSR37_04760 [Verrucomicrobia bacterium]|nr:hypothetical protein [Verrucomicrobiota bacterium]MBS0636312.1 hypothetical protein [Verrucomicrobiota bacterium]
MSQENIPENITANVSETVPANDEVVILHEEQPHPEDHPAPTEASLADFEHFVKALKDCAEPERKLDMAIQFMQERLAQTGVPHFKEFWDARRLCLDLFKENINPTSRVHLWAKYSELCRQARRLKEIFDEQSAFAAEQIEIAVAAIEAEIAQFPAVLEQQNMEDFVVCHSLQNHQSEYAMMQTELNLLNTYATKTSALRKELIKTEMRIRQKNKFFERLSKLGDAIFPRRKELIQKVSKTFADDVDNFVKTTFVSELKTVQLFNVRDEIKALQSIAKVLTLNTEAFSSTRKTLSECWDSIKDVVKERRKVVAEQKTSYKQHRDHFVAEMEALKASFEANQETVHAIDAKLDDLSNRMRATQLGKLEIRELRDMMRDFRSALSQKSHAEDAARREQASKKEQEKRARNEALRLSIQNLVIDDDAEKALEALAKEVSAVAGSKAEKQEFEKIIRNVRDAIAERREQKLLNLSADDREALDKLKELLKEKKQTRQAIKAEIDKCKRESGLSGLDFALGLQLNDMIESEKERLEKVEASIDEIETKLAKLQRK